MKGFQIIRLKEVQNINMKKNIMIILVAVIFIIAVFAIHHANNAVPTEEAVLTTFENSVSTEGFIVRDEITYYATAAGTPYFNVPEGNRVSRDALIATIFEGDVDLDKIKELSLIDIKLNRAYDEERDSILHTSDAASLEGDIMSRVSEIYEYASENDIQKITEVRDAINSLRSTGQYSTEIRTGYLEEEKRNAESRIGYPKKEIYTELSGVFSTYIDGLESVLQPERIEQYTPSYIRNLKTEGPHYTNTSSVETGDPICKVMNNHVWYVLAAVHKDRLAEFREGKSLNFRFKNMANAEEEGVIDYISEPDDDGYVLVLLRCSSYLESVFSYRKADVDIIFKSYTGYKVPTHAVRTSDSGYKVVAQSGAKRFDCDVDVLYTDNDLGYSIVQSTQDSENKLSNAERIVVGDK